MNNMKYSITRKINLGKYGIQYESIDIAALECDTKEQAMEEIQIWEKEIDAQFKKPVGPINDNPVTLTKEEENNLPF